MPPPDVGMTMTGMTMSGVRMVCGQVESNFQRDILALVIRHFCFDLGAPSAEDAEVAHAPPRHGSHASDGGAAHHVAPPLAGAGDAASDAPAPYSSVVTTGSLSDFLCAKSDGVKIATFDDASPRSDSGLGPRAGSSGGSGAAAGAPALDSSPQGTTGATDVGSGVSGGTEGDPDAGVEPPVPPLPPRGRSDSRPEVAVVELEVPAVVALGTCSL
jgi:hypothetical protein